MNRAVYDRWLLAAAGLVVLLVAAGVLTVQNTRRLNDDASLVAHTHEVMDTLEEVIGHLREAEAAQRTYLILGGDTVPPAIAESVALARQKFETVRQLTADNPEQQGRLADIEGRVEALAAVWARTAETRREQGFEAARQIVASGVAVRQMGELQRRLREVDDAERVLLRERSERREQTFRWAVVTGVLTAAAAVGGVVAFVALLRRHLTARAADAARLAEQEERLRTTLASIGDAVITTDTHGRVATMNAVAESLTGWPTPEAAGRPLDAVFRIVNETTRRPVENPVTKALKEGVVVGLANHTVLIARDGTERPIDDSAAPIRCDGGQVVGCVLVFRDISERYRQEAELRGKEEQFRTLAESIPQLAWMANPDGHIFWYNRRWYEYTGTTFERMEGWGWQEVHDPDELPRMLGRWRRSLATGEPWEDIFPLRRHDGEFRPHLSRAFPVKDDAGRVVRWFGTNTDVTDLVRAENALRESEGRLRTFVAHAPVAIAMFDRDMRYLAASGRWLADFGFRDDPTGLLHYEVFPTSVPERWKEAHRRGLAGEVVKVDEDLYETGDGAGHWLRWEVRPWHTAGGAVGGILIFSEEITARKRAEERLRAAEERFRLAAEAVNGLIYDSDVTTGTVWRSNGLKALVGYAPDEADPTPEWWLRRAHPDDVRRGEEKVAELYAGTATAFDVEYRVRHKDGHYVHVWERGQVVRGADGRPVRVVGSTVDISERKEREAAVAEANRRLEESVALLDTFLTTAPVGLTFLDPDFRFVRINDVLAALNGRAVEAHLGRTPREVLGGQRADLVEPLFRRVLATGQPVLDREISARFGGELRAFIAQYVPVRDAATGALLGVSCVVADISDRKRAEERLAEAHQFLQSAIDALASHVAVLDERGVILAVNAAWRQFADANRFTGAGYGVGANYLDACEPRGDECSVPDLVAGLRDVLAGRVPYFEQEYPCHSPTERRWFVMRATRFPPPGPVRVVVAHDDVTRLKRAEDELRAGEEKYRFLVNTVPALVWSARPDGTTDYHNDRWYAYTGLPSDGSGGEAWRGVVHPDDVGAAVERWAHSVRTGQPYRAEYRLRRAGDGEYRWWQAEAMPMRDEAGGIVRWFGTCTDIHDRRLAEQEVQAADRRKDEFLATLAHELRNPLAPVRTAVQILNVKGSQDLDARRMRDLIERQVIHLVRLVDDLLDLSRISRGKIELRRGRVRLAEVIQNAVETSSPLVEGGKHRLTVTVPPEPLDVEGDTVRLTQVVANLINNAAKYTPEGGHIGVAVDREGGEAVIRVRDTGLGIPPDMLGEVFEMFTQVNRHLGRSQGGLGIGLTLVKRLVEMHGGTVAARSEGDGRGAEFTVRLPLAGPEPRSPAPPVEDPGRQSVSARRILVVDDNADAAESLALLLSLGGHDVRTAPDGPTALERVVSFKPGVVFLDLGMPGMDGYETARRMRELREGQRLVLVALTGWGQEEDRRRTKEAGFDFHLVKPVDPAVLQELLSRD